MRNVPVGSLGREMISTFLIHQAKTKAQLDDLESAIKQQKKSYDAIMKCEPLLTG